MSVRFNLFITQLSLNTYLDLFSISQPKCYRNFSLCYYLTLSVQLWRLSSFNANIWRSLKFLLHVFSLHKTLKIMKSSWTTMATKQCFFHISKNNISYFLYVMNDWLSYLPNLHSYALRFHIIFLNILWTWEKYCCVIMSVISCL
jgi:hypothetical protein